MLLELPLEIRLQIYEDALEVENCIAACSCANTVKPNSFLGDCVEPGNLEDYSRKLPHALCANQQTYHESRAIAWSRQQQPTSLVLGGTRCFRTFLINLPKKHPERLTVVLRFTAPETWAEHYGGSERLSKPLSSMLTTLGIGTGQAFTVSTHDVRVLPIKPGPGLGLYEADVDLDMRLKTHGWMAA
jgi:hypothetical protein